MDRRPARPLVSSSDLGGFMPDKLLVAAAAVIVTFITGFSPVHADSRRAGFSTDRLTRVDALLDGYVRDGRIGGIVAIVLRDGKPVYEHATGWRDREAGQKMTTDT